MKILSVILIAGLLFFQNGENIKLENSSLKKIDRMLKELFHETVKINPADNLSNSLLTGKDLYTLTISDKVCGHMIVSSAKGRFDYFDYCIVYNLNAEIMQVEMLVYRSDHGFGIGNKKWLLQFAGMKAGEGKTYAKDIDAISGATLSGNSITNDINGISRGVKAYFDGLK